MRAGTVGVHPNVLSAVGNTSLSEKFMIIQKCSSATEQLGSPEFEQACMYNCGRITNVPLQD